MREDVIHAVREKKLIAIVRGMYGAVCTNLARALLAGGITLLEVTFDPSSPARWKDTTDTIKALTEALGGQLHVGAGTVLLPEQVEMAQRAGAEFILSPDVNEAVIRKTTALDLVSIPGAMTPTEILTAHCCGADFVKVFPVAGLGAGYLAALRKPLGHIPLLAVGGVDEENLTSFLAAGAVGVGMGGNLVNRAWLETGDFDRITRCARRLTERANS